MLQGQAVPVARRFAGGDSAACDGLGALRDGPTVDRDLGAGSRRVRLATASVGSALGVVELSSLGPA